ncbi:oxidoreductase [Actinocatenispora thailandica]|uniref:Oxidoreductase n=1 Tax=Actinocatenispora thailandica TaxID=227318 RepID=A0A7R7DV93_9ACTN|nr:aldo/keto reductase [Actinocatenispora thailandica]BCJ38431.1 oxidoreductase [Actinocatenispora thailandica]
MGGVPGYAIGAGVELPAVGLGTYPMRDEQAVTAVRGALRLGYRLIDTAASYDNEEAVGRGIAAAGLARDDVFVTTKLRGRDHGYQETLAAFEASRLALGLDYLDLYLIHWPLPRIDRYVESWRAMMTLRSDGLVRSIGVSNFTVAQLDRLIEETGEPPAVNQIELHPYFPQQQLRAAHEARGIRTESWSPLARAGELLREPVVVQAAQRHGVEPAQVVLRWHVQLGAVPIPKSASRQRQATNLDLFGFELDEAELAALSGLARGRQGGDPERHEEF